MIVKKQEAKFIPSTIWFFIVKKLNPLNTTTSQIATPWDDVQMVIRGSLYSLNSVWKNHQACCNILTKNVWITSGKRPKISQNLFRLSSGSVTYIQGSSSTFITLHIVLTLNIHHIRAGNSHKHSLLPGSSSIVIPWPVGTCDFLWDVNGKVRYRMIRSNDQMTDVGEVF